jgi:membrane fusion protein (multidrug efflux system)
VFDKYGDEADAEIARIIAENAGPNGGAQKSVAARDTKAPAKAM